MAGRKRPPRFEKFTPETPPSPVPPRPIDSKAMFTIDGKTFQVEADELETRKKLGRGAYGIVELMYHQASGTEMAVKRITCTVNSKEQKRLLMD